VLGLGLLARMVGDGVTMLAWLRWLSPFGLLELSRPYAGNRWGPLALLAAGAAGVSAVALLVAARRDVGGGLVAPAAGRPARTALLGSVEGFAVRRALRPLLGWSLGVGAYFLLIGLIATTMISFLTDNPVFADAAGQAGFVDLTSVRGYAATLFALLAVPVGVFAADRVGAFAAAEGDRRLTLLAAQPVSRVRLLGAEVAAVTGAAVLLTTVAGAATWLGVVATGGDLTLPQALAGVWNTVPVTLLSVGAAVIGVGWLPGATVAIGALPAVGGFLLQVIAQSAGAPGWVVDLSPFAHLALVPVASPNPPATFAMVVIALAMAAVGTAGFHRRDLRC
jgi:ABC-2 type transport system permease protein